MKKILLVCAAVISGLIIFTDKAEAFSFSDVAIIGPDSDRNAFVLVTNDTEGEQAKATIDKMGQRAIDFLGDSSLSQSQKEKKFRSLLNDYFDMPTIGRFTLGSNWKDATDAQRAEYQKLFEDLVVKVYAGRFNDYKGQGFNVSSYRDVGKKDLMVSSYIIPDNGSKIKIDWRVRDKGGQYKVVDVIIEGVSMSLTQRADFNSVISRGGGKMEALLDHLRK